MAPSIDPATPEPSRRPHPLEQPPPTPVDEPPRRQVMLHIPSVRPYVVYVLLAINLIVFGLRAVSPTFDTDAVRWGANYGPAVLQQGEIYRLLSSMFLHSGIYGPGGTINPAGILHIVFNCYMIFTIGTVLERLFGHVRFALIYFLGGLTGSIFSAVLAWPPVFSIGASGAVFALLAAQYIYLRKHRRLLGAAGRRQMANLVSLLLINAAFGLLSAVSAGTGGGGLRIDNFAHLGGAVGGAALAWFISPYYLPRRHPTLPDALTVDDINPLSKRYNAVVLFGAALLFVLLIARFAGVGLEGV